MTDKKTWNSFFSLLNLARGFGESRVFLTGVELGIFPLIVSDAKSAEETSKALGTDPRGTTILLDALAAMEILVKTDERYQVNPSISPYLDDRNEESIIPMLHHSVHIWDRWSDLTHVVRTGKPRNTTVPQDTDGSRYNAFILAMHVVGRLMAEQIVKALDISQYQNLLDIGGASGTYTIAFLRANARMKATLFDLPRVIPLAEDRIKKEGMTDRVTLHPGDFYSDSLPSGHDLALLSAIIHQNSRRQNRDLYRKIEEALAPGGRLIIRDHIMDDSHTHPPAGAFFAINMLVATEEGGTYTFNEIREDLETAGFGNVHLVQNDEKMDGLIQADRNP